MIVESLSAQVGIAVGGGAAAELLHWYLLARKPEGIQPYLRRAVYWVTTAGMVALGGLMPLLYLEGEANALLCFHLGAATPLLLQKLVSAAPDTVQAMGGRNLASGVSLRSFFRW